MGNPCECEEYRKFKLFLEAAQLKGMSRQHESVPIDPSMSITVEAHVLAKLIKEKVE